MRVDPLVERALSSGDPVVALESTIFSHLGLPSPANAEALTGCLQAIRSRGGTAAITAVFDGVTQIGVPDASAERICGPARKCAARDLPAASVQQWSYGATTVSASVRLAARAGISVFATGGIGGVHRDVALTNDISADLQALADHQVVTVCSGAKVFLDLPRTLELLETSSVPVLGWQTDHFPAFYAASSGLPVPQRVETGAEVSAMAQEHWDLGGGGILVVSPVPEGHAVPDELLAAAVETGLNHASAQSVTGPAITPVILAAIAEATGGKSLDANVALAVSNAGIAAEIATALSRVE